MLVSFRHVKERAHDVHCDKFHWPCCGKQVMVTSIICVAAAPGTDFAATDSIVYVKGRVGPKIFSSHCVVHASLPSGAG